MGAKYQFRHGAGSPKRRDGCHAENLSVRRGRLREERESVVLGRGRAAVVCKKKAGLEQASACVSSEISMQQGLHKFIRAPLPGEGDSRASWESKCTQLAGKRLELGHRG